MPHELLAKPGTVTSNSIVEGAISYDSSASNILFVVKAAAVQISSRVDVVEVTGADDTERIYEQGRFCCHPSFRSKATWSLTVRSRSPTL